MSDKRICAIYTRKSSDEGLDMEFNSLDAQREACEAYIQSQKSEGWAASHTLYDDGGFSGGNLDRPGLQALLADIKAGRVNIVVVYKIDRLTRSLMDFSKLVEVFDAHGVTFVSVTQSFNTTTSMGRLTLNVLLSFAQFEREVTGERIRDKIAASKKKGMWMGGTPPMGYEVKDRKLVINNADAEVVRHIYQRYAAIKGVKELKAELERQGITTPARISETGKSHGGRPFSRGHLYRILQNPIYIGQIAHKDETYEGLHEPIIGESLWHTVQRTLNNNATTRTQTTKRRHMLAGLLFDEDGTPYSPTFTKKGHKQYRYYISQNLLEFKDHPKGLVARLPGHEIEQAVIKAVRHNLGGLWGDDSNDTDEVTQYVLKHHHQIPDGDLVSALVQKITLSQSSMAIRLKPEGLIKLSKQHLDITLPEGSLQETTIHEPYRTLKSKKGEVIVETTSKTYGLFDLPDSEIQRLVQGIVWRDEHFDGLTIKAIADREGRSETYVRDIIMATFMHPTGCNTSPSSIVR